MSNSSNFRSAIRQAQGQALIGPNVISNALPYLGGGLILTAVGIYGGLRVIQANPALFMPTFIGALVLQLILFLWLGELPKRAITAPPYPCWQPTVC